MSGPVDERDAHWINRHQIGVEVRQGRQTTVGGMEIARVLPTKGRRTIGAWCFVDLMLPPDAHDPDPLEIGPHPHIGLHTVTWLFTGEALHTDSLGTEQVIRPGQLNLMTAGDGIAHAELSVPEGVQGAQMWIAQPETTRHGPPAFEHHARLPRVELGEGEVTVIAGSFREARSPARTDSELVGLDLRLKEAAEIELRRDFEYGFVPVDQPVKVGEAIVEPGWLGLVERGPESVRLEPSGAGTRLLVIGGVPLGESIQMWWNFVARSKEEMAEAWRAWQAHDTDRFGPVSSRLARLDAPRPPWLAPE